MRKWWNVNNILKEDNMKLSKKVKICSSLKRQSDYVPVKIKTSGLE